MRADAVEFFGVDAHAARFHPREHGREWQINFLVDLEQTLFFDFRTQDGREAMKKIGTFAGSARESAIHMTQHDFGELCFAVVGRSKI